MFVYDDKEPENIRCFKRLPVFFQEFITGRHASLRNKVVYACRQQGKQFKFTSGYRAPSVNQQIGGVIDSLHLYGLAIDFVSDGFDCEIANKLFNDVLFIDEKNHVHCQYRRGV